MEITVLIPLLIFIGEKIVDLVFTYLKKRYGTDLMNLSYSNVENLEKLKEAKVIDGDKAEDMNVAAIQQATAQSPGISKTWAKLVNWASYAVFVKKTNPEKFASWFARNRKWEKQGKGKRTETDFSLMGLYISAPDRKGDKQ